ncbi:LYR motif-containing protein 4 [Orchesella cincta]|uniref:LYR motif-containing protein 4 n=1 Tax=Orchesella cincta TaxID=48709 RepID=A0A1D2MU10_ORCCI|nr:LYR motif-containing protein 4 [Orchesella cincta]
MSSSRMEVLRLYKVLLRESQKFPSYNYRNYFIRRIRDAFRENQQLSDKGDISREIARGNSNLNVIKRQVMVGQLYQSHKLVIEMIPASVTKN